MDSIHQRILRQCKHACFLYKFFVMAIIFLFLISARTATALESFEFIAEHVPEVAMDNRFATLPIWSEPSADAWDFVVQGAAARTRSGAVVLDGAMFSIAALRALDERWAISTFAFWDELEFSGTRDQRPLATVFTTTPLALPAAALFTNIRGTYRNVGAGLAFKRKQNAGWMGERQWAVGALLQRVTLRGYQADYRVLDGASAGAAGLVDYSGTYTHLTPFVGMAWPREWGGWQVLPHTQFALPIPRRGIQGRITGPSFDITGNTETAGRGSKHFGDASLTFGLDVTYQPWGLTVDIGTVITQALMEPAIHKGINENWVISVYKKF